MKYAVCTLVSVLVLCAAPLPASAEDAKPPFPLMEDYIRARRPGAFLRDGLAFVRDNPKSPHVPRVVFDMYMLATLGDETAIAENCKTSLVLEYADSVYGTHVFRSFPDGRAYGKFLAGALDRTFHDMSDEMARNFTAGVRRGAGRFGGDFLEDNTFALKCLLVALQAGEAEMARDIEKRLRGIIAADKEGKLAPLGTTVDLCVRKDLTTVDRILKLDALAEDKDIPAFIAYLRLRLSPARRREAKMARIGIRVDLCAYRFIQALKGINALPAKALDPQVLYWKAWCLFAEGKQYEALEALTLARKTGPRSPWRDTAAKFAACIKDYDRNMLANVDTILAVSKKFRAEADVIEFELETLPGKSKPLYRLYLGLMMADGILEIVLLQKDSVVMAYRTDAEGMRIYFRSSKETISFPGVKLAPAFTFNLTRKFDGTFTRTVAFRTGKSLQQGVTASEQAWNSPYLTTKAGLLEYLGFDATRGGHMPASITKKGKTTVLKWTTFSIHEPETTDVEFHVRDENVLTGVRTDYFRTRRILYGRKSATKLSGPKWPDAKVRIVTTKGAPFAAFAKLLGEFMKLGEILDKDE